jgi:hypothetical protein
MYGKVIFTSLSMPSSCTKCSGNAKPDIVLLDALSSLIVKLKVDESVEERR